MKIVISQKNPSAPHKYAGQKGKKIFVEFHHGKRVEKYAIDKADEFLACVDKFIGKSKIGVKALKNAGLELNNLGLLTERTIRAIMLGLSF